MYISGLHFIVLARQRMKGVKITSYDDHLKKKVYNILNLELSVFGYIKRLLAYHYRLQTMINLFDKHTEKEE